MTSGRIVFSLATVVGAPITQSSPPASSRPPVRNLVVVTLDTVRADHLGCYDYFRDTTPHLDAFAAQSLRFTRCLTPIAQTTPSHTSLFTGVAPYEHGVFSNHSGMSARPGAPAGLKTSAVLATLAEVLRARGMKTGGFVAATPVKRHTGLAAGFEAWAEPDSPRRGGREVIADALKFIDERGERPYFLWVHLFDAHEPLRPPTLPKPYLDRFGEEPRLASWLTERAFPATTQELEQHELTVPEVNNHYDGALRFLDEQLEVLLERLRRPQARDATAIVVVADHGTSNGQHSLMGHGVCWDEQFRVPLLIRVPGVEPRVVDVAMSTLDLWPTLFALAPELRDEGFAQQCRGSDVLASGFEPRPIFGMAARQNDVEALTAGRWKLLRAPRGVVHLFDLDADPFELADVSAQQPEIVARLSKLLDAEVSRQKQAGALRRKGAAAAVVDPKVLEELRALGYAADGGH